MNTTNPTTWRDIADQLTDIQIGWLTTFENQYPAHLDGGAARDEVTLDYARNHAEQNKIDRDQFGHLPEPEGARRIMHWENDGNGRWSRGFDGKEWTIHIPGAPKGSNRADVDIAGSQFEDGTTRRDIYVSADSAVYTAGQARQLAAALLEAADELDVLTQGGALQ